MALRVQVPFVDLSRMHDPITVELEQAFSRVMSRGSFTLGEEVDAFESEFAAYVGTRHAVGVGSGTDALHLVLRAFGVGPGDEVITAANTFAATAEAIVSAGATPVFVDVDESMGLIDVDAVEAAISPRTAAVIPVHLWGQVADMRRLNALCERHDLVLIEDACQAHGAQRDGFRAGSSGHAGCFSFYPSKNLGALGDGGIVTTDDPAIAEKVRLLRNHGEDANRLHTISAFCSRLHGMQVAFLRVKLVHLDSWNASRREAAAAYARMLAESDAVLPTVAQGSEHVFHLYVVQVEDRDRVRSGLGQLGIQTGIHYAVPLHLEPAFESFGPPRGALPVAERLASRILSLPMYPFLTEDEVHAVARALEEVQHS